MTIKFSLLGVKELTDTFENIKKETIRKGGRASLRKAANIVANAARSSSWMMDDPDTGRKISENISVRWNAREFKRTGSLAFKVGVKHGSKIKKGADKGAGGPTPHWRLLEFGTSKMRAKPFMRPALENNIGQATGTFIDEFKKYINRAIKRGAA